MGDASALARALPDFEGDDDDDNSDGDGDGDGHVQVEQVTASVDNDSYEVQTRKTSELLASLTSANAASSVTNPYARFLDASKNPYHEYGPWKRFMLSMTANVEHAKWETWNFLHLTSHQIIDFNKKETETKDNILDQERKRRVLENQTREVLPHVLARCFERLGDEADTMTDEELAAYLQTEVFADTNMRGIGDALAATTERINAAQTALHRFSAKKQQLQLAFNAENDKLLQLEEHDGVNKILENASKRLTLPKRLQRRMAQRAEAVSDHVNAVAQRYEQSQEDVRNAANIERARGSSNASTQSSRLAFEQSIGNAIAGAIAKKRSQASVHVRRSASRFEDVDLDRDRARGPVRSFRAETEDEDDDEEVVRRPVAAVQQAVRARFG